MPDELIPRLSELNTFRLSRLSRSAELEFSQAERQLADSERPWSVPNSFVERWVAVHDGDWSKAEEHWELLVEDCFETDAVDKHLKGSRAVRQAVTATILLINHPWVNGQCRICPVRRKLKAPEHSDKATSIPPIFAASAHTSSVTVIRTLKMGATRSSNSREDESPSSSTRSITEGGAQ